MGKDIIYPEGLGPADQTTLLVATSADIDPNGKTYVVLYWYAVPKVSGYNLYRRKAGTTPICLNRRRPIRPVQTCAELKALVPEGSPEWQMLAEAFSAAGVKNQLKVVSSPESKPSLEIAGQPAVIETAATLATINKFKAVVALQKDPCEVLEQGLTAEQVAIWDVLAAANLKLRQTRGLAFVDRGVVANEQYIYELRGVAADGSEVVLSKEVKVQAGHYLLVGPPSGYGVAAGDGKVLATWNRHRWAFNYVVQRSVNPGGPYQIVSAEPIIYDIEHDLDQNLLEPPRPGFLDFQHWDADGLPADHLVNGTSIQGPTNGVIYYYQVASRDSLDRIGPWSPAQSATPMDQTPPMAPVDFRVDPCTTPSAGLVLSWRKVTRDVQNHQELDAVQTYRIYRADNADALGDLTNLALYLKATVNANPGDPADMVLSWTDTDPILVPPYGEKDFWYLVQCVDAHGNAGTPSVQISGRVPDTRPPGGTEVTDSKGYADHIQIFWDPNPELDLAGYQIYRSICDQGQPYRPRQDKEKLLGCDFVLVGDVSRVKAEELQKDSGSANFDDYSVPPGSPLCYAYWVRAYDASGNLYGGDSGCPMNDWEYICQRLYEKTPPPVPIITGLKAKNNAVLVEWIASPVQDLRAFHIYRGKREDDPPDFAGCVLSDGTLWPGKWGGLQPKCEDIPAEADPDTVHGSFLDEGLEPNLVYWYRVSALDWLGNESEGGDLRRIPAISTFTYSRDLPSTPTVSAPTGSAAEGCGLMVNWIPPFDPGQHKGFLVFRSSTLSGNYRQVSPLVPGNNYADASALRGIDYWYRVQAVDRQGKISQPSAPVRHRY